MKLTLVCYFFIISLSCYSQDKFEYLGVLKLTEKSNQTLPYQINFTLKDNAINGFSVTDMGGENETKCRIIGTYDNKTKILQFSENSIIFTKSKINKDMFCFIHYTGKVKIVNNNGKIEGPFQGLFFDKKKGIDGKLILVGSAKLYTNANKINAKIQRSKFIPSETKNKINTTGILDGIKTNYIKKDQTLRFYTEAKMVQLFIQDPLKEDGDIISIYNNDALILNHYTITKEGITIPIQLKNNAKITVVANNEGSIPPNTSLIKIIDGDQTSSLISDLKENEKAFIEIIQKNN